MKLDSLLKKLISSLLTIALILNSTITTNIGFSDTYAVGSIIKLTSSGTWTVPANVKKVSITLVGGGGGGGLGGTMNIYTSGGGGGGGGYVANYLSKNVIAGQQYYASIGNGGGGSNNGSATSFMGYVVNGGKGGHSYHGCNSKDGHGDGGSAGGSWGALACSNGNSNELSNGQGATTRGVDGNLYGGGGGTGGNNSNRNGCDGGGTGGTYGSGFPIYPTSGVNNTGGGGGGGADTARSAGSVGHCQGGTGGSGVVVIRIDEIDLPPSFSSLGYSPVVIDEGMTFSPVINVTDSNNDSLNCTFYLDGEPYDKQFITNTIKGQNVTCKSINANELVNGAHTFKLVANDGYNTSKSEEFTFNVSKSQLPKLTSTCTQTTIDLISTDKNDFKTLYWITVNNKFLDINGNLADTGSWIPMTEKTSTTRGITIKGLSPLTQYTIQAKAKNVYGSTVIETPMSAPIVTTTLSSLPIAVGFLKAEKVTEKSTLLTWGEVAGAVSYVVEMNGVIQNVRPTEPQVNITDLRKNSVYKFRVWAKTADGVEGNKGEEITVKTGDANLKSPTKLRFESVKPTELALYWEPVIGATGYEIVKIPTFSMSNVEKVGLVIEKDCPENNILIKDLQQNTSNIFIVRALNENGESPWSQPISRYTTINPENILLNEQGSLNNPPSNPLITVDGAIEDWATIKAVNQVPNNTVKLHMVQSPQKLYLMANGVDTTKPINFYIDSDKNVSTGYKENPWKNAGADYRVEGNVLYKYTGTGADWSWSNVGSVTTAKTDSAIETMVELSQIAVSGDTLVKLGMNVDPLTLPTEGDGMVTALGDTSGMDTVTTIKSNQIGLSWKGISGAMSYQLEADGEMVYEGKLPTFIHKGLKPETQHSYRLRVKNLGGWGPWSNVLTLMTSNGIPQTAPVDITSSATDESITINWKPLDETESYDVVEIVNGVESQILDNGKGTTCQKKGLKPGTTHIYKIRGKNTLGEGPWSNTITVTTFTKPTPVITNSVESDTQLAIEWAANEDAALNYTSLLGSNPWDKVATTTTTNSAISYEVSINGTSIGITDKKYMIISNLRPETKHLFRVREINPASPQECLSQWSEELPVFTTPIRPDVPSNVNATVSDESISITWDMVPSAEGYDIELDGVLLENDGDNKYIHDGLTPFTLHKYRVRARNGAAEGNWSELKIIKTLPSFPISPSQIEIKSYATGAELMWDAIPGAKGYDIEITEGTNITVVEKLGKPYFNHRKIKEGAESRYRIRTRNVQGVSEWSGIMINNAIRAICTKDNTLDLGLTAHDVVDFSKYTMTVTYNTGVVDVEDLSTKTGQLELGAGQIEGTDITIVSFIPGKIVFKCDKAVEPDESWTGVINSIKFKAKHKGGTTITYTVLVK